jgi:hypothetical protein
MITIKIPKTFYQDHCKRDCPAPSIVSETSKHFTIDGESEHLEELYSDASHYSTIEGAEWIGLRASAKATANAIRLAAPDMAASFHKQWGIQSLSPTNQPTTEMNAITLPSTAEYGTDLFNKNEASFDVLDTKPRAMLCGEHREVILYSSSAGYVPAGSCARLQASPVWGYRWHDGRSGQGRMYRTLDEAQAAFDAIGI